MLDFTRKRVNMLKEKISEKLVVRIWQCQAVTNLITDVGEPVCVVFPGRVCNDGGCDFQDAVFTIGGKLIKGNIEVHLKSSHWYSHGHHQNKRYNDIVLHLVMWHDYPSAIMLQNGETIPTVCLSRFLKYPLDDLHRRIKLSSRHVYTCLEAKRYASKGSLTKSLITAGKKRFAVKAAFFQKSLVEKGPGQVLLRSIARALGYDKNVNPFEELADKLTLSIFESIKDKSSTINRALLLGTAGLLPSQRPMIKYNELTEDTEINKLEAIWRSSTMTTTMNQSAWCFHRVRPDNFPSRRVVALSYLVTRHCQSGLLKGILKLVREAPDKGGYRWIENGLTVPAQGYWASHFDFGIATTRSSALIGRSRAAEIAINVLLPFAYAYGEFAVEPDLKKKAINLYFSYPGREDNQLTRFMKQQLSLDRGDKLSSAQQQGLIHIFKTFCRHRNCHECLISINRG